MTEQEQKIVRLEKALEISDNALLNIMGAIALCSDRPGYIIRQAYKDNDAAWCAALRRNRVRNKY